MLIGVLSIQGAFMEHIDMLHKMGISTKEIRNEKDLDFCYNGIIIPGGESSVMGKLLRDLNIFGALQQMIKEGMPVFGTCAGMILLSSKIENEEITHLATMDICVMRNAYGRQLGSFNVFSNFAGEAHVEMPFIRAPYITSAEKNVEVLSIVNNKIVAARQDNQLVTAFHPELTGNQYVHKYFLNMISKRESSI